jgi:hypothetical protein
LNSRAKNAALAQSQAFDFDWNQTLLHKKISSASFVDAKEILEENITEVKDIFSSLPPDHELETIIRGSDDAYTDKIVNLIMKIMSLLLQLRIPKTTLRKEKVNTFLTAALKMNKY